MKITIHKKNEIIRGGDNYSLLAKRALNTIYWILQKHDGFHFEYINIQFKDLRSLMGLSKVEDYIPRIKRALQELRTPINLNNFFHPHHNQKFQWYSLSFLDEVGFSEEKGHRIAKIKVNAFMKELMQKEGNFTKLDLLLYQNRMRTKYAMKLYEFLKSFSSYHYIEISLGYIQKLLGLEELKKYQHFSQVKQLLQRQIKEIQTKTDLQAIRVEYFPKRGVFKFILNPKASQTTPNDKEKKRVLEAFLTRTFTKL